MQEKRNQKLFSIEAEALMPKFIGQEKYEVLSIILGVLHISL